MVRKAINSMISVLCLLCILLSGCQDKNNTDVYNDSKTNKITVTPDQEHSGKGDADNVIGPAPDSVIHTDRTFQMKENVVYQIEDSPPQIQYNVKAASLFTNIFTGGADPEDLYDSSIIDGDGNLQENYVFIVLNLNILNLNISEEELNIAQVNLLYDSESGKKAKRISEHFYFLDSQYKIGAGEYYHYVLAQGREVEVRIGWVIDKTQYDLSKLFLSIGEGGEEELKQFVHIKVEG